MAIQALSNFQNRKLHRQEREEMDLEHNILLTTIRGPIDYAAVKSVAQVRARCFNELAVTKIASIVIFEGSMKVTPDAVELFSQVIQDHTAQSDKTLSVAYVAEPDIEDRAVTCAVVQTIFSRNGVAWQAFEKLEDAQVWAQSMVRAAPAHRTKNHERTTVNSN